MLGKEKDHQSGVRIFSGEPYQPECKVIGADEAPSYHSIEIGIR